MTQETVKTSGIIPLKDGYRFIWIMSGNEVWGSVEGPDYRMVPKSGGWYRTTDPQAAAKVAETLIPS